MSEQSKYYVYFWANHLFFIIKVMKDFGETYLPALKIKLSFITDLNFTLFIIWVMLHKQFMENRSSGIFLNILNYNNSNSIELPCLLWLDPTCLLQVVDMYWVNILFTSLSVWQWFMIISSIRFFTSEGDRETISC